jgi:hypothetical protein
MEHRKRKELEKKFVSYSKENYPEPFNKLLEKTFGHSSLEEDRDYKSPRQSPPTQLAPVPEPKPKSTAKLDKKRQRQDILILLLLLKILTLLFEKNPELKKSNEYTRLFDAINEKLKHYTTEPGYDPELKKFYDESKKLVDTIPPEELERLFDLSKDTESADKPMKKAPKSLQDLFFEICHSITKTGERVVIQVAFAVAEMITPQGANQETSFDPLFLLTHSLNGLVKNPEVRERNKERLEQLEEQPKQTTAPTPFQNLKDIPTPLA